MSERISIADLPTDPGELYQPEGGEANTMVWGMALPPHLDLERIELSTNRLDRLHRVGAFSGSLVSEYFGETSSETYGINCVDSDGAATASKTASKHIEPRSKGGIIDLEYLPDPTSFYFGKPVASHRVNREEVVNNVIDSKANGKSDEQAWARELDLAIRSSFVKAGQANLMRDKTMLEGFCNLVIFPYLASDSLIEVSGGRPGLSFTAVGLLYGIRELQANWMHKTFEVPKTLRRGSVFPYRNQVDRYIGLTALSKAPGLVSYKK